ncbi:TIGR01777 family oxidoreductase [Silvimonas iriomotensis]|uniref:Epimerase n=1 Tax=Silvimonas iriomotensis TaxID=449662 RepID=A0ABQ2P961_9NEIS|nr:TIGR01777 family oxidoreductase [Silvimonas iriomotensis]GGP21036.1 epimerase [Silvimonas iriomotensis]
MQTLDELFNALSPQRVLMTGGTGFIGRMLAQQLVQTGHSVTVLARDPFRAGKNGISGVNYVGSLAQLDTDSAFDAVISLAGAPVAGPRWTAARKAVLLGSRINTARAVLEWLERAPARPAVWIQASAIGFYGVQEASQRLAEHSAAGHDFASQLCAQVEAAAAAASALGMRVVSLRFGIVLGHGGALPALTLPIRWFVGGRMGDGRQMISWIHQHDVMALFARVLADPGLQGPINAVAPQAMDQAGFVRAAAGVLRRPLWLHLPASLLRVMLGEMAQLFVGGQHVVPEKLTQAGFVFRYPTLQQALADLL